MKADYETNTTVAGLHNIMDRDKLSDDIHEYSKYIFFCSFPFPPL